MYNLVQNWNPKDGLVLEINALKAGKDTKNALVIAGPGAGKTELLAQKACFLLETNSCTNPRKILAISFKKDAAANLKERVNLRLSKDLGTRFISQTFDSFAKSILDRFRKSLPDELRPAPNYEIASNDTAFTKAFFKCGINISSSKEKSQHINRLTNYRVEKITGKYKDAWNILLKGKDDINPTLNFKMISLLALYILEHNPLILKSIRKAYSNVFLDEFQDTTRIQYELVKICFYNTNTSITAVGDTRQRIMLWAGAMENVFEFFRKDFQCNEYILEMNHRSAPRLLEIQKVVNKEIQNTIFTPIPNPKWKKDEGISEIWYFKDSSSETIEITKKIKELISNEQISPREICIIAKQEVHKYVEEFNSFFVTEDIKARNEAIYQDLLCEDIVLLIINTINSALDIKNTDAWIYIWEKKLFFEGISGLSDTRIIDNQRFLLKKQLKNIKKSLDVTTNTEKLNEVIYGIIESYGLNKIMRSYPQYSQVSYVNKLIEDLVYYLIQAYNEQKAWQEAIKSFLGYDSIPVMTIHKSKGLEFDVVFFVGFDDNSFWTFTSQEGEDLCTFFVGLSRSKRYLYFTFSENRFNRRRTKNVIAKLYKMLKDSNGSTSSF